MKLPSFSAGELYSLGCAILWAVGIVLFRKSGQRVSPVALNLFKNAVGLILFLITLPLLGVTLFPAEANMTDWLTLIVSGVIGIGIADSLFFASLNRLGAGNSAIVDSLYSPFVVVSAFFYLGEALRPGLLIAVALMAAAILMSTWQPRQAARLTDRRDNLVGIALGVLAVLLMALGLVMMKPVLEHTDAWWVTTVRLIAGTSFLVVQAVFGRHRASVLATLRPSRLWRVTIPAGVIGCYLAMITWILGMKHTFASTASVLNQTSTIWILLLAALFLGEPLHGRRVLAVGMAFAGTLVVTW